MDGYLVPAQLSFLTLSIAATVFVGRTLYRHGRIFLVDAFGGNAPLADAVNHLLVVGFYLINVGYVCESAQVSYSIDTLSNMITVVAERLGTVLIVLGVMHFLNLYVFSRIRRRGMLRNQPPPVLPAEVIPARKVA